MKRDGILFRIAVFGTVQTIGIYKAYRERVSVSE
jgi:hypothetical protein